MSRVASAPKSWRPRNMDTVRPSCYSGLADKTVFITGGEAASVRPSRARSRRRGRVGFVDIAEGASRALIAEIQKETGKAPLFIACDLRDIAALQAAIEKIRIELGTLECSSIMPGTMTVTS